MAILIERYRTWITVQGIYRDDWFLFVSGGLLKRYANPVFNLIVKWPRGNKVRGQVIGISEYEMDRAIRKLSNADTRFARRIRCLEPTPEDVEAIVLEASWGYVQLELEVYDKNLRTNKQPLKDDLEQFTIDFPYPYSRGSFALLQEGWQVDEHLLQAYEFS